MNRNNLVALLATILICTTYACNKDDDKQEDDPISAETKAKATALDEYLKTNALSLTKYYSDSAIDYIDTDQVVKAETDLWQYVSAWIKDDKYVFNSNGEVTIQQNAIKIPADTSVTLTRSYSVEPTKDGVVFNFVGHEYQPLQYKLINYSDTSLKLQATWNGKTVNSEYKTNPNP
jgi:hypothetical protein